MIKQKQKSPNLAETGFSKIIHSATMNKTYLTMIRENPKCLAICCEFLDRYEELLHRFLPSDPCVYRGKELDAFITLSNITRALDEGSPNG